MIHQLKGFVWEISQSPTNTEEVTLLRIKYPKRKKKKTFAGEPGCSPRTGSRFTIADENPLGCFSLSPAKVSDS